MIASSATPASVPSMPTVGTSYACGIGDPNVTLQVYRPSDDVSTIRLGSFFCPSPPAPVCGDSDIIIVLDRSGTMNENYSIGGNVKPKIEWAKIAAQQFVDKMFSTQNANNHIRIGVVSFGSHLDYSRADSGNINSNIAWKHQRLSNDQGAVTYNLSQVHHVQNGTCISCGIQLAYDEFVSNPFPGNPNAAKSVILLSDGWANSLLSGQHVGDHDGRAQEEAIQEAIRIRNLGGVFYVLGYGSSRDDSANQKIAGAAPGVYVVAQNPEDWAQEFSKISSTVCSVN